MARTQNSTAELAEQLTDEPACSIERSLEVLGERWTFLILRQLFRGQTRFSELRESLGIGPNLLSARLRTLTDAGVVETAPYQEIGARQRQSYHLTEAGSELWVVLLGLQQWGDVHRPRPAGPSAARRSKTTGKAVRVAFVDEDGIEVPVDEVEVLAR